MDCWLRLLSGTDCMACEMNTRMNECSELGNESRLFLYCRYVDLGTGLPLARNGIHEHEHNHNWSLPHLSLLLQ